ncbi:hypothetical protein [Rhizobium sp. C4]|uniref:hypothetical protein n=1 Tax=Rhizobium sp. C4 TaxID=1349800 RepID=UPI001E646D2D|nr:hypothetical protein [Rhizobium sp. C4]MCD2174015.1 hypothetical protein [Rhizobium sp. C4]
MQYDERVERTFFRSGRTMLMALAMAVPFIAGCTFDLGVMPQISLALRNDGGERQLLETLRSKSQDSQDAWNELLGENLLYVSENYRTELTSNKNLFLGAVLGSYFYNHPELGYEQLNKLQHSLNYCGPACKSAGLENKNPIDLDPAQFEYYKNWGRLWQQSLRSGPEAAAITERYELFKKRIQPHGPFHFSDIRDLIRDDSALTTFLTDDDAARQWMSDHLIRTKDGTSYSETLLDSELLKFNPVTFTSLPGLAS